MTDTTLIDPAREVAKHLGAAWSAEPGETPNGDQGIWLHTSDGTLRLHMMRDWRNRGRLIINGRYPDGAREYITDAKRVEITVAADRAPAAIAAEITRRLLPGYEAEAHRVAAAIAKGEADKSARAAIGERLRQAGGKTVARVLGDSGAVRLDLRSGFDRGDWYGDATTNYGDGSTVTLSLHSLPADLAVKLLRVLAGG